MGKFDFNFDTELTRQLERLENYDEIAEKILTEAIPILERKVVSETDKYHEYSKDYELVNSIKATKPKKNKNGWYIRVIPTGNDKNGVRNMEKMAHLEYGYTTKKGKDITPKPIITKALNDAREEVNAKMQEVFNEAVNNK